MSTKRRKVFLFLTIAGTFLAALAIFRFSLEVPLWISSIISVSLFTLLAVVTSRKPRKFADGFEGKISVVIPAKNEESVIERTVTSIEDSEYASFDIIILDDGSTDRTPEITLELSKRYENVKVIRVPEEEPVHGKAAGLNRAVEMADGDVILVIDADVVIGSDYLSKASKPFSDTKIGFVQTGIRSYDRERFVPSVCDSDFVVTNILMEYLLKPRSFGRGILIRKETFQRILPLNENSISDDRQTSIKLDELKIDGVFNPTISCSESSPETMKALWLQRKRWFLGDLVETLRASTLNFVLYVFVIFLADLSISSLLFRPLSFPGSITVSLLLSLLWAISVHSRIFGVEKIFSVWIGVIVSYFIDLVSLNVCVFIASGRFDKKIEWYKTPRRRKE